MQYSIINYAEVRSLFDLRIDSDYWQPAFIRNSRLVPKANKIGDFVSTEIANIKSSPLSREFEYLEIANIALSSGQYTTTTIAPGQAPERAHHILAKGDVVVSSVRPNRNAVALLEHDGIVGSSGLVVLRAKNIAAEYLFAFCKTHFFIQCLLRANKATMYPAVAARDVFDTPLFLPTESFRRLIVAKVKQAFALSQDSRQAFSQAQNILLAELGLLDWQPRHRLSFVKHYADTVRAGRIDAEYFQPQYEDIIAAIKTYVGGWETLGQLVHIYKSIEVGSEQYREAGIPFVRVSNLSPFELTAEKYISANRYAELKQHQPRQGEILLSKDATPGIAHYLRAQPQKMLVASGILRLKSQTQRVNNEYLTVVLNSILTRQQVRRAVGGSVILHWRPEQVKNTVIPLLAADKQTAIEQIVVASLDQRQHAQQLLVGATRAIQMAIEQGERTASKWLQAVI